MAGLKSLASAGVLAGVLGERWAAVVLALTSAMDIATATYVAASKPPRRRRPQPHAPGR